MPLVATVKAGGSPTDWLHLAGGVQAFTVFGAGEKFAAGFVFVFLAALIVVRPFLRFVSKSGFARFAWYRIAAGLVIVAAVAAGWL